MVVAALKEAAKGEVVDASFNRVIDARVGDGRLSVTLALRPFDLRTLVFTKKK